MLTAFVTHNTEDRAAYFGRALPALEKVAAVTLNPLERDLTTSELVDAAAGADVVIAHRSTAGEARLFEDRPELLAFLRTAVDISTVDVEAASRAGVLVARAGPSFVPSTAELAIALVLDVLRHVSDSTLDYRSGIEPPQRSGRQLRDSTVGIIGYGAIGSYLADAMRALGAHVVVTDPHVDPGPDGFERLELRELLRRSDIVLPLAPASPATERLIDAAAISEMRRGAVLVNVSRGELLDEDAVADALERGHLAGVGLDVGRAPDQRPSPLLSARDDVVATPHLGGLTPQNADAQALSSVEQVVAIAAGQMPPRAVNPEHADRLRAWWSTTQTGAPS